MIRFSYKNNKYKYENGKFYIYGGDHGGYISEVKDKKMLKILLTKIGEK